MTGRLRTIVQILISASVQISIFFQFAPLANSISANPQETPPFSSAISAELGAPVDFLVLYERANSTYEVVEHDPARIVWRFADTT